MITMVMKHIMTLTFCKTRMQLRDSPRALVAQYRDSITAIIHNHTYIYTCKTTMTIFFLSHITEMASNNDFLPNNML